MQHRRAHDEPRPLDAAPVSCAEQLWRAKQAVRHVQPRCHQERHTRQDHSQASSLPDSENTTMWYSGSMSPPHGFVNPGKKKNASRCRRHNLARSDAMGKSLFLRGKWAIPRIEGCSPADHSRSCYWERYTDLLSRAGRLSSPSRMAHFRLNIGKSRSDCPCEHVPRRGCRIPVLLHWGGRDCARRPAHSQE